MTVRLLIDTDNALGSNAGDVDDGFAIAALRAAPGRRILERFTALVNSVPLLKG